ncbi:MAG: glycerol-3-phosphate dehydrogenase/oxidase [Cyclobacteriaceae bacterium]
MVAREFSVFEREKILERLRKETFDLLVIGGGITGAGIALDASSRGLKTAVLEKSDFAFGTSGRSTKLIHGGLRYLKQFEFGLVREVGSERAVVHKLAPHLVHPEKMLLPLSERKGLGYWVTSIGLRVYDYLAGVRAEDERRMLSRSQTLKHEPLLKPDDVNGGAIYAEYRTDDARLTVEVIKAAVRHNACILNYARVNDFIYHENTITGVSVTDDLTNESFIIESKSVVSATGPWVDYLRDINNSKLGKKLHLTKGVHIVVPHEKFPVRQAVYFDVEDGRMIFSIPRGRITYIGTTDTTYTGDPDRVVSNKEDAQYLLNAVNANFPTVGLKLSDIESSWAGLRPLIHEEGKSTSELSRKDEIFESPSGLISIAGGKLTGYRKMAERVVNLVIKKHFQGKTFKPCFTNKIKLPGSDFSNHREVVRYIDAVEKKLSALKLPALTARYLVENYGRQTDQILAYMDSTSSADHNELRLLKSELQFTLHQEMVASLSDFFVRRTGLLYFDIHKVQRWKNEIAIALRQTLRWDETKFKSELRDLDDQIRDVTKFS